MRDIDENAFLEALKDGVARTTNLIAKATDYHGGPVMTEYLLTADIAREFIERDYPVAVECHNRMFVNAITGLKAAQPRKLLRSKRTDVAVIEDGLIPLALATVENLQRQNMTPLEEAGALTKLVHKGVTLDDVVAQTGLSATTIKRRLALNALCKEAKALLAKGGLALSQAEALTLGGDEAQRSILEQIENGSEASAEDIKGTLLDDRPTVALAIFPVEQYTGTITTDLFAEDETSYFDDAEQFTALQKEAVAELVKHHEESAAWVEQSQGWHIPEWQYRKARKNQKGGVLINLAPSGRVEIREGLARVRIEKETAKATAENPAAPVKVKAAYAKPLCGYIAHHKAAAVAERRGAQRRIYLMRTRISSDVSP